MSFKRLRKQAGFTLIELLIVIVILGTLASIALPNLTGLIEDARVEAVTFNTRTLLTEIEVYRFKEGTYPTAANTSTFITNFRDEFNALDSIVQEIGIESYEPYHYNSDGDSFVFSVKLPGESETEYVGIKSNGDLEEGLNSHLNLE
ncbi:general secretion pathway protein G [Halanaerobium sp. DL-01]|uniref:type II secretion system protein n=1 Tax=Halanaerobium sp. DL-01 TaxID=1653064 RepID=UPI000DF16231|nr:type II secretion system protein [Halanaerobium sp. DL-01]RCW80411.1 general secretion pathway protein G [Halanaerobium sp. DL-01]